MENIDFIENEGVEYSTPIVEQVVTPTTEQVEQPVEEEKSDLNTETTNDKVDVVEPATEEPELVILPDEETEVIEQTLNGITEIFGNEFKTKEEAKQYVETLKSENETLKKQGEEIFANDTVKALNDYMKNGGANEKEFLDTKFHQQQIQSSIEQVKNLDPLEVVKHDYKVNHGLTDEEVESLVSLKTEVELKVEGNKLKKEYINTLENTLVQSKQQEADMIKNVEVKQQQFKERIASYVGELKEVGGVQVNDKDRQRLSSNLSNPAEFIRKHFPLDEKGLPTKEWAVTAAKLETHNRLVSTLKNKVQSAATEAKKEVFNQLHNIPKQEATVQKTVTNTEMSEGEKIVQLLQKQQSQNHYN